jgi:hypothetical protein
MVQPKGLEPRLAQGLVSLALGHRSRPHMRSLTSIVKKALLMLFQPTISPFCSNNFLVA